MFKTERMDLILEILHEKKHATIDYLSKHVFASNVTIRRDLKKMEDLGLVIRSYGGVTLMDTENKEDLQDMLIVCLNQALQQAKDEKDRKMQSMTSGISIPGVF